jgi:voltage-gated potassium channel Kch
VGTINGSRILSHPLVALVLAAGAFAAATAATEGGPVRRVVVVATAVVVTGVFLWATVHRMTVALRPKTDFGREVLLAGLQLAILLVVFGYVHSVVGLEHSGSPGRPIVHDFSTGLYFSVATFTTLGYGDYVPVDVGKAIAAIEALVGFLVLGILASASVSVLASRAEKAGDEAGSAGGG